MKSAVLLLGASLAVACADGFFGFAKNTQTLVAQDSSPTARDAPEQAAPTDLSDATIELGHCHGGHCHKPDPKPKCKGGHCHKPEPETTTVTKVCKECVTVTKPVTILVPDPTTVVKTRMCTTTMIRSRTVTRCVDHTKTCTKYCPVTRTSVQTVTVDPTCTPKPKCHHDWQFQHVVEEGDYCENLASVYNTTVEAIQDSNSWLNSTCDLTAGEVLCIPKYGDDDDYSVKKRDVAHHHHHHHKDDDGGMTCDPKIGCDGHHHHHGHHHHGHHHHGHHHGHHHHHHHKDDGCDSCNSDHHHHDHHGHHHHGHHHHHDHHHHEHHHHREPCGEKHECVACTSPESCSREGMNALCPVNFMCQAVQIESPEQNESSEK